MFEFQIPKDDPLRLLRYIVEGMDLSALYRSYSHPEKNQAPPRQLLEILIYANMNCIRSSSKIEQACKRGKHFEVSKFFQKKRTENLKRIASAKGIKLHVNSSIQAKGAFADVKQDLQFRRFL